MSSGWQDQEGENGRDSPSPSPPPPPLPAHSSVPGLPQEYVYGSSDEEDEEGEGAQGTLQVSK